MHRSGSLNDVNARDALAFGCAKLGAKLEYLPTQPDRVANKHNGTITDFRNKTVLRKTFTTSIQLQPPYAAPI